MLGDERSIAELFRETLAGVELHRKRRDMRTERLHRWRHSTAFAERAEIRISDVAPVTIRKAKIETCTRCDIELARRLIVTHPIAAIVREP